MSRSDQPYFCKLAFNLAKFLVLPCAVYAQFTQIDAGLAPMLASTLECGDYDNDGDPDLLVTGQDSSLNARTIIYANNGNGTFTDINAGLVNVAYGAGEWGDYDHDGDLDVLLTGFNFSTGVYAIVYRNDGGVFTDIGAGLVGVTWSSAAWGDYDNDGDLDIVLSGSSVNLGDVAKVYRNDGNDTFTDISAGLVGLQRCSVAWGDYDRDGDLDIGILGQTTGGVNLTIVYRNDGGGTFTDINAALPGFAVGKLEWADYDRDGDLDLLVSGFTPTDPPQTTKILRNDGGNVFTDAGVNLPGEAFGDMDWADYDNDGDLDVAIMTTTSQSIYRNDGGGVFTKIPTVISPKAGEAAWADIDHDGDLDLAVFGSVVNALGTIYRNDMPPVTGNTFTDIGANTLVSLNCSTAWEDVDNDGDLDAIVSGVPNAGGDITTLYRNTGNSFIASTMAPHGNYMKWCDFDVDGDVDYLTYSLIVNLAPKTILYGNDGTGGLSEVAAGLPGTFIAASADWGDYDNDGDKDIALTVAGNGVELYRNNRDGSFSRVPRITSVSYGAASITWGDYDRDGDVDLLATGIVNNDPVTAVYRNDGGGVFTDINAGLRGVWHAAAAWADIDNDGDLDILAVGLGATVPESNIYRNEGNDVFTPVPNNVVGVTNAHLSLGDCDNDGDLDLLLSGNDGSTPTPQFLTRLYRNDGSGSFTDAASFDEATELDVAWGDYDKDGDLDFLVAPSGGAAIAPKIYNNNRSPLSVAGGPYTVECVDAANGSTTLALDGSLSFDPDHAPLTYAWSTAQSGVSFDDNTLVGPTLDVTGLGPGTAFSVKLRVDDGVLNQESFATVTIQDTSAPEITVNGSSDLTLEYGAGYTDAGATATDACEGAVSITTGGDTVDTSALGDYIVTYDAVDASGNHATQKTRTVHVVDTTGPVITLNGPSKLVVLLGDSYTEPGATATDAHDGNVSVVVGGAAVQANVLGDYIVTYNAVDQRGNHAVEVTRLVRVKDRTEPVFRNQRDLVLEPTSPAGAVATYAPKAIDNSGVAPTVVCDPPSGSTFAMGTTTTVRCTATDGAGNVARMKFTVKVLNVEEMLDRLSARVARLRDDGALRFAQAKGLQFHLRAARNTAGYGNYAASARKLHWFIVEVKALVRDGNLDAAAGDALIKTANNLRAVFGA